MSGNVVYYFPSPFPYTLNRKNRTVSESKKGLFITNDGKNLMFTFILVSSLFLLWGICNGMIDVDGQALPDGTEPEQVPIGLGAVRPLPGLLPDGDARGLAGEQAGLQGRHHRRPADGGGGRLLVSARHATSTPWLMRACVYGRPLAFVAFLAGVCAIAAGLTFLETIANPYTTVLGPQRYAATRINLAQSCNGVGWIFGPIIGGMFFYLRQRCRGQQHRQRDALYSLRGHRGSRHRALGHLLLCLHSGHSRRKTIIISTTPPQRFAFHLDPSALCHGGRCQFFYVAAQAGIFSFFINYMTLEVPPISESLNSGMTKLADSSPGFIKGWLSGWFETRTVLGAEDVKDLARSGGPS